VNGDVSNYSNSEDPRVSSEEIKALTVNNVFSNENVATISAKTQNSKLSVSCSVFNKLNKGGKSLFNIGEKQIDTIIEAEIEVNEKLKLEKYSIYTDSLRYKKPEQEGIKICKEAAMLGSDYYFEQQREYLKEFWNCSDVLIEGNEAIKQGVHYNLYQLLQSVGKDKYSNIAAKGLSGEGYEGHYFWDTEIYMFPFYLLTEPEIAKNLLMYRYGTLEAARANARVLGHKNGALFPWRTIVGSECSGFFPAGTAQYHINADIAYAFIKYFQVTGDIDFTRDFGAEVLFETARLWLDTGHFRADRFTIEAVTGPDEYTCIINNNYYTNLMAKYNLKWASKLYYLLKENYNNKLMEITNRLRLLESEVEEWSRAYEQMYLPYDAKLDINPQDDSFLNKDIWNFDNTPKENYPLLLNYHPLLLYRYQVCKQADTVLAYFLLEEEQKFSTIKNSFDYYEKITTHDSSLSSCIFSIMASRVGYPERAYDYFMESVRLDLDDTHGNTKDGIHTANMGGSYLAIVYGFAGLRIKDDGIYFNPRIPSEWSSYEFKIKYNKRIIKITINKLEIVFDLLQGDGLDINLLIDEASTVLLKLGYDAATKNLSYKIS
jgi:alpha,alpha-trehalose phosphorylase